MSAHKTGQPLNYPVKENGKWIDPKTKERLTKQNEFHSTEHGLMIRYTTSDDSEWWWSEQSETWVDNFSVFAE